MPLSVSCPGCREPLDVEEEYRAWRVRCPRCATEFVPDDPRPARPADALAPPRRGRDDGDDYDDRPRRRRRRYDRDDYDDALVDVFAPAVCLETLGWLGLVGSVSCAGFLALAGAMENQPGAAPNNDGPIFIVVGIIMGVLGLPYSLALTIAGRHLRRLTSRTWATTGAVLALAGFVLFGLFGVLHLAAGIWALVTTNRPHVQDAFDYHARYGRPPRDD